MQSVDGVLSLISKIIAPAAVCRTVLESALNQVLAEPVAMAEDSPPFDRATVDGFAVRAGDVVIGVPLVVAGQIVAGAAEPAAAVLPGQCAWINTGAPLPEWADGVLMVEHSQTVNGGQTCMIPQKIVTAGHGVQRRGADARAGGVVLPAGCRLGAAELAVCAAAGAGRVPVRRLRAALLVSGDELVAAGTPASGIQRGQIRNSNHPMLMALMATHAGATPRDQTLLDLGTAGDDAGMLRTRLLRGLESADLLVVSGGMSMGTKDLIPPLLRELGVTFHVEKVRIKPGKPFILGTWQTPASHGTPPPALPPHRCVVAGLPGNPVSAFVTFQRFVRPLIGRLLGEAAPEERGQMLFSGGTARRQSASIATALPANGDREFYQPCMLANENATLVAHPLQWKGSADLFTLARADALVIRPANAPALAARSVVAILELK